MSTLQDILHNPEHYSSTILDNRNKKLEFRPLMSSDGHELTAFIRMLGNETLRFYSYKDDPSDISNELIDAIAKYDKLRFILLDGREIVGLFELSFDIPESDRVRFENYNIKLESKYDCRFGPVLRDEYQSLGIGSQILPLILSIARKFNQKRILLWGGVHSDNVRAIRYYEKNRFKKLGVFTNQDDLTCYDMIRDL